jgi:glycosyltransferase involved in cell wall biosynthesis
MTTRVLQLISSGDASCLRLFGHLAESLRNSAIECRLALLGGRSAGAAPSSNGAPAPTILSSTSAALDPRGVRNLRRAVSEWSPHVVHAVDRRAARYAAAGLCWGRQAALLIGPVAGSGAQRTNRRLVDRLVEHGADCILVADEDETRAAASRAAVPVGIAQLTSNAAFRAALLEELSLASESKLIGVCGPLLPQQRVKDAIWAADLLKCVREDAHLLVLGDGPHRWRLERYRRQVQITDRVHFLGNRSDEPEILASLDCYWETRQCDRISIPMLEAMSAGVPVLAADAPINRWLLGGDAKIAIVPPGDRASRARHTNVLLNDAEKSQTLGQAGRQLVLDRFPPGRMIDAYRELYAAHASRSPSH